MKKIIGLISALLFCLPLWMKAEDYCSENLVIVMDCSGSMSGIKIAQAKNALKEILEYIPANTRIGLLSFGENSGWKYSLGPRDNNKLIQAIDNLYPGGNTPLGEYMKYGADRLLQQREKQLGYGTYRLLVITDGEAQDRNLIDLYTPEIMARGITVDVIGVFMQQKHSLSEMAHSYRQADDADSLKKAITEVLAEVGNQKDDSAAADAFETIAALPDESVPAFITALSYSPDYPIGEKTKPEPAKKIDNPPASVGPVVLPKVVAGKAAPKFSGASIVVLIIVLIFGLKIFISAASKKK